LGKNVIKQKINMNYCGIWQPFINTAKPKGQSAKPQMQLHCIRVEKNTVAKQIRKKCNTIIYEENMEG
jgi:hypothetical protein